MEKNLGSLSRFLDDGYIMAVEDSMVQARKLQQFFERNQLKFKLFTNAIDALDAAEKQKPILVISDIVMPGMDGYEFCAQFKANPTLAEIPVILLTALGNPGDIVKGLQAGADSFITKPYDESYLLSRVRFLLENTVLREKGASNGALEIVFQGDTYEIKSDKRQILNLLLSVYEAAVIRNTELGEAKKKLEELNKNLVEANEELDAFARTVSHDLRSPLSGIIGFTQISLEDYADQIPEEMGDNLNRILETANKMSQLISDLLNYSRSAKTEMKIEAVNLSELAREILWDLKLREPDRDVESRVQDNMVVSGDKALLRIALVNLLGNAWKYTGRNGNPEIGFGIEQILGRKVFVVSDNGVGFSLEKAEKLFMPFVRLHSGREFPGTGVGLSTVKRIIERHAGSIWAESRENQGARFMFTLHENS